jgi:hypothetical protein
MLSLVVGMTIPTPLEDIYPKKVLLFTMVKQRHTIEIFSANYPLCKHITDDIQIGN